MGGSLDYWPSRRVLSDEGTRPCRWSRRLALLAGLSLIGSFLSVLYHVTQVVGGTVPLAAVVAAALLVGTLASRWVPIEAGLVVGAILFALGLGAYLVVLPNAYWDVLSAELIADLVALALGDMSALEIRRADLWAVAIAPAPVYGTWYLLGRRRYGQSAWIGGLALAFFVLTGDASEPVTLVGTTGALGVLGFGTLDRAGVSWDHVRDVGIRLAAVVVLTRLGQAVGARLSALPATGAGPVLGGEPRPPTLEASLVDAPDRIAVLGSISLSPDVRFSIEADRPAFWHVGSYDRFAGGGWVRTGGYSPYSDPLAPPPGATTTLEQTVRAKAPVNTMPAAWKPVRVDEDPARRTRVTALGGLQPTRSLTEGESYTVTSERPSWTEASLRAADGEVPEEIRRRYLQVPDSTPDRLGRFVTDLTADAGTRFERAAVIEQWLEANKEYSLSVPRPDGDVADAFVFEMQAGYCVYFATAMTIMLRTVDVPARFAVGYTTGQPVADGEWVIRGFNSHTWVEVFVPDVGWVPFDPTPSGPRQAARGQRLGVARDRNRSEADTDRTRPRAARTPTGTAGSGSGSGSGTATPTATAAVRTAETATPSQSTATGDGSTTVDVQRGAIREHRDDLNPTATTGFRWNGRDSGGLTRRGLFGTLRAGDQVTVLAGIAAVALGINRYGLLGRGYRILRLHWQFPTDSPAHDTERAFDRLEVALGRQFRDRRPGETRRAYVEAVEAAGPAEDRLLRVLELYETARYSGEISREDADEAMALVDSVVRERLGLSSGPSGHRSSGR